MGSSPQWYEKRWFLFVECMGLFFIGPAMLYFIRHWVAWRITPVVLFFAAACLVCLLSDRSFDRKKLWKMNDISRHFGAILLTFAVPATIIGGFTFLFQKTHFLYFISAEPVLWLVFIVLYPLLAVYPQEIVFRAFFFHRYQPLFPGRAMMIVVSGMSFGVAHLFYNNWFAPLLSTFGGMLFAYRYGKAESIVASTIEHGLWGNFLFTIGMGWYFYSGSIR